MIVLFLHGLNSTPGGTKPTYLKDHGHTVLNPALPDDDFEAAVRIAQAEFDWHQPEVVVGSSRGGAVAMNMNSGETPLVLLCPAWKRWGTATTVKPGTVILHSKADETVPFADSQELLCNSGLGELALVAAGTEHRLADEESLKAMVEAVEGIVTPPLRTFMQSENRCMIWLGGSETSQEQPKSGRRFWSTPQTILLLVLAFVPAPAAFLMGAGLATALGWFVLVSVFSVVYAMLAKSMSDNYPAEGPGPWPPYDGGPG
jgi:hypothetical protein